MTFFLVRVGALAHRWTAQGHGDNRLVDPQALETKLVKVCRSLMDLYWLGLSTALIGCLL